MINCKDKLEVDDLNRLKRYGKLGIYKKWILNSTEDHDLLCDCLQKINFSCQDLKSEIEELSKIDIKSIVFIITLTDWILGAYYRILNLIRKNIVSDFSYGKEHFFEEAEAYFKAIRSFVCAHPTKTTSHPKYGFDGNYICVDIRNHKEDVTFPFVKRDSIKYLDINGLHDTKLIEPDFFLYVYSKNDTGMQYFSYIGVNYCDIYNVANVIIDKICELDRFLSKTKKKDYIK